MLTNSLSKLGKVFLACLLVMIASFGNKASATHYAAADLYLDYVGTSPTDLTYRVTLVVYKACEPNNASLSPTEFISWTSSCFTGQQSVPINAIIGPDTMDQLCPNFAPVNMCRVDTSVAKWPAFVRYVYQDNITFPSTCTDTRVSWQGCDRNYGIQNLQTQVPTTRCLYIEAGINNVVKYNNNTPRFTVDPIPYLCDGQPSFFLNGPFDPDNDSVETTNTWPWEANNAQIPYLGTYSLANPIASSTGYTVNPFTGTASFTPTIQGKFVLAFNASDYDRTTGVELSHIRRDVQVSVLNCNAAPPDIDSIPQNLDGGQFVQLSATNKYLVGCAGLPMSYTVTASSQTISNSVYLASNNATIIPASNFTVAGQGTGTAVGTFTWIPTNSDVGDYTIIFTAKDSTCNNNQPIVLKNYFVLFIKIYPSVDAGPDGRICKLNGVPWQFNVTGPAGYKYQWTGVDGGAAIGLSNDTIPNPTAYPPHNFEYVVTAVNFFTVCKNKDTAMVWIDTSNAVTVTPHDAVLCRPGYFQLMAQGVGLPPLANLQCGILDTIGCTTQDTFIVNTQDGIGPPAQSSVFSPFQNYRTAKIQFLIPNKDIRAYGIRSGTIKGMAFNVKSLPSPPNSIQYNNFTISLKCTDRNDLSAATGGMEVGPTLVYTAPGTVIASANWNQFTFDRPYSVDSSKSLVVEICYNNTFSQNAVSLQVNAVPTATEQMAVMYNNTTGSTGICQNPGMASTTVYYQARPSMRFNMCTAGNAPFNFTWWPGTFLSDSTIADPLAYINKDVWYHVKTIGRNGCIVTDSGFIKVPVHHYDIWPKDTSFCYGQSFKMIAMGDFASVKWNEVQPDGSYTATTDINCDDCREPIATPAEDTKYAAIMTDVDGCSDTLTLTSKVKPLPLVHILNNDTTIKYGQSLQLYVSGAYLYSWQPISSLTNPNISNPYASPTEPTKYYVQGLGENGCRNVDSVTINIDYRDNLFVPSAFTPNGDGNNDVFRVANITFQKLQEFRIFNRWGQEIYSTTDPKKGWDGSWKGVPQDIGSYQYLIKVAYPDGYIETYKGDVTLIR